MAEVLVRYVAEVLDDDGTRWTPQACGGIADDGLWEGWIEFVSGDRAIRTGRETEQPSRDMVMYWAQGLTATYLEGALARATRQRNDVAAEPNFAPRFESSGRKTSSRGFVPSRAILNPFTTLARARNCCAASSTRCRATTSWRSSKTTRCRSTSRETCRRAGSPTPSSKR
jgi:hypothetical protein